MAIATQIQRCRVIIAALALIPFMAFSQEGLKGGHQEAVGTKIQPGPTADSIASILDSRPRPSNTTERVRYWNAVAVDSSGLDHTPVAPGEARVFGEQVGPGRASRAVAIVHVAMFDALNAVKREYRSFSGPHPALFGTSGDAALAQAAHDTLVAMFPSQRARLGELLREDLARIRNSRISKALGIALGRRVASAVLLQRSSDGAQHKEPRVGEEFPLSSEPGAWSPDPVSQAPLAMGAFWGSVKPFAIDRVTRFRPPPPPPLRSRPYAEAFDEVKRLGGDPAQAPTERTEDQTIAGIYWAYDGTPSLCAPPRLFNQIALQIARQQNTEDPLELLRLLTLVNIAMTDATIVAWEAKYHYNLWRPVTGVRVEDGNRATSSDPGFIPLGAPASNLHGPNFTPPFPAYPSGHASMGGAMFQVLRRFYDTDDIAFTFVSDEFNGVTLDNRGQARPLIPRSFRNLTEAETENGLSRVYLGVHWRFDSEEGIRAGRRVGDYVFERALKRVR